MLSFMWMSGSLKLNESKFKEALMKYECGENMSAKEGEQ